MDQEIAPDEAGIETDRIRAQQVKSFQTGEHLSPFAEEHKPRVGERLVEPFETAPDKAEIERLQRLLAELTRLIDCGPNPPV